MKVNDIVIAKTPDYMADGFSAETIFTTWQEDCMNYAKRVGLAGQVMEIGCSVDWITPHKGVYMYNSWWDDRDLALLGNIESSFTLDRDKLQQLYNRAQERIKDYIMSANEYIGYDNDRCCYPKLDAICEQIVNEEIQNYDK
jgi:hypothetical protein